MIKNGKRELCYTVKIDSIEPIIGSDNCEAAVVGGWRIMTRKGTFQPGDLAVYFEIDSKVPEKEPFEFLASKHYKIKSQKYTFGGKGNFLSQGLLMSLSDFPNLFEEDTVSNNGWLWKIKQYNYSTVEEHQALTEILDVKYSIAEDNKRKSSSKANKYAKMYQRHLKLFKKYKILRKLYNTKLGKKILFIFLGKKRDGYSWPEWVQKTDEERCQNLPQLFPGDNTKWIVTEKIDGSSTTFTLKKRKFGKREFYVCSRNVCFDKPEKADKCYYDTNIYLEMADKYNIEEKLNDLIDNFPELDFITLQGETYGAGVQKRDYSIEGHDFAAFNLIYGYKNGSRKRINSYIMRNILDEYSIPSVPILETITLPETCDDLLKYAEGKSQLDGKIREGIVLRTEDGVNSFKAVSNEFLIWKGE